MPPEELASLTTTTLQEARGLTVRLGADILQYFIEMAILESLDVERDLASKRHQDWQ